MHYVATFSDDSTIVAAGFKLVPGMQQVLLVRSDRLPSRLPPHKLQALKTWLAAAGVSSVDECEAGELDRVMPQFAPAGTPVLANVTGGSKELSAQVIESLPEGARVVVLDAHGASPQLQDLSARTRQPVPSEAWLTVHDLCALNFPPGSPRRGEVVHAAPLQGEFHEVLSLLSPEDLQEGALLVRGDASEQESAQSTDEQARAAVIVMKRGRSYVIAARPLRDQSLPWTVDQGARNVREALRNHRSLTRSLVGDTGISVFLKRPGEELPTLHLGPRMVFTLANVLREYNSYFETSRGLGRLRLRGAPQVQAPKVQGLREGRTLLLTVGFQPMPLLVAALSRHPGQRPFSQLVLISTPDTREVAEKVGSETKLHTVIVPVSAVAPEQVTEIVQAVAQRVGVSNLEVNITGGLQGQALQAFYDALQLGASVSYTDGQITRPVGKTEPVRRLPNTLSISQYFAVQGFQASVTAEVNLAEARLHPDLLRQLEGVALKVMETPDKAAFDRLLKGLVQATGSWLVAGHRKAWDRARELKESREYVGFAYEVVVLTRLLRHYLHAQPEQGQHLWQVGWGITLERPNPRGDLGRHELDLVLLTSRAPVFLEAKTSISTAIQKNAHLRLTDIQRAHGANYVSAALVVHKLDQVGNQAFWPVLRDAAHSGMRLFTTNERPALTPPGDCQDHAQVLSWFKRQGQKPAAGVYRVNGRSTLIAVNSKGNASLVSEQAAEAVLETLRFLPTELPPLDQLW